MEVLFLQTLKTLSIFRSGLWNSAGINTIVQSLFAEKFYVINSRDSLVVLWELGLFPQYKVKL